MAIIGTSPEHLLRCINSHKSNHCQLSQSPLLSLRMFWRVKSLFPYLSIFSATPSFQPPHFTLWLVYVFSNTSVRCFHHLITSELMLKDAKLMLANLFLENALSLLMKTKQKLILLLYKAQLHESQFCLPVDLCLSVSICFFLPFLTRSLYLSFSF